MFTLASVVIPAKAGIQRLWVPAFAGMTEKRANRTLSEMDSDFRASAFLVSGPVGAPFRARWP
jgi:hypothetical protein